MWRRLQWQQQQQRLPSPPSMTLPRVSGILPSVPNVLPWLRSRQQLPVVAGAPRRGSISGMALALTGRVLFTGRVLRCTLTHSCSCNCTTQNVLSITVQPFPLVLLVLLALTNDTTSAQITSAEVLFSAQMLVSP